MHEITLLERNKAVPLYIQLKEILRAQIEHGSYTAHDRIPSERELAQRYNINRMTVRRALADLVREGLFYARVGKGTFVSDAKIDQQLELTSYSENIRQAGLQPSSRVLEASAGPASTRVAQALEIRPGASVVTLNRIRLANGEPLAIEKAYLPFHMCPDILQYNFAVESLYTVLHSQYGYQFAKAQQTVEATLADDAELELLGLTSPAPILRMERVTYIQEEIPIEYVLSSYRGDRCKLRGSLRNVVTLNTTYQ